MTNAEKNIDRLRKRYHLAFAKVMMRERGVSIDICLSALMATYGELIAQCSPPGQSVATIKACADALKIFADTNAAELEKLSAPNIQVRH